MEILTSLASLITLASAGYALLIGLVIGLAAAPWQASVGLLLLGLIGTGRFIRSD